MVPNIIIERSPAKVTWLLKCNGIIIDTQDTKVKAEEKKNELLSSLLN